MNFVKSTVLQEKTEKKQQVIAKNYLRVICFFLLGILLIYSTTQILIPKHIYDANNPRRTLKSINYLENNCLDVAFVGSSHIYCGISPMKLYEQYGIVSYDLSTSAQPVPCSYFLLKDLYKTQNPKVVVLDVGGFFRNNTEEKKGWLYLLNSYPFNKTKLDMLHTYQNQFSCTSEEMLEFYLPIISYHDRWNTLMENDFFEDDSFYFAAGYIPFSQSIEAVNTPDQINSEVPHLLHLNQKCTTSLEDGIRKITISSATVYDDTLKKDKIEWLQEIERLCSEHGTQLVLTKVPVVRLLQEYSGAWTESKSKQIKELAEELSLPYLDLEYGEPAGLDFTQDTMDGGSHLNIRGADKLSVYLGEYLSTSYDLERKQNLLYDKSLQIYQIISQAYYLQSEEDFKTYLRILADNLDRWDILIADGAEFTKGLDQEAWDLLNKLGLTLILEAEAFDSYVGVISDGQTVYEELSANRVAYDTTLDEHDVSMTSSSWRTGSHVSIMLDGNPVDAGNQGLNFVVIDRETGLPIDSVAFDTYSPLQSASRNSHSNTMMYNYSKYIQEHQQ